MTRQIDMTLYINQLKIRYKQADRKGKIMILNEFCSTSGYHRKHAIRLLARGPLYRNNDSPVERRGRKKLYDPEPLLTPLNQIWLSADQMCGKRLKAAIPIWLLFYEKTYGALSSRTCDHCCGCRGYDRRAVAHEMRCHIVASKSSANGSEKAD